MTKEALGSVAATRSCETDEASAQEKSGAGLRSGGPATPHQNHGSLPTKRLMAGSVGYRARHQEVMQEASGGFRVAIAIDANS